MRTRRSLSAARRRRRVLGALLGGLLGLALVYGASAPEVAAQGTDRNKAKKVYKEAKAAYDAKEFDKAAELFKEAYGYDPKPELLFNIGQALKEGDHHIEAAEYLQRFLQELPNAPNREQVAEQVFELQQIIAAQASSVTVQSTGEGHMVYVDEELEPQCVTPCVLTLPPGPHQVKVVAEGMEPDVKDITLEVGSERTLQFAPGAAPGARGKLVVKGGLSRGKLLLDGSPHATFPISEPLDLEVGPYPAAIEVDGKTVWSGSVDIAEGKEAELNIVAVETAAPAVEASGGPGLMGLTGWALGGVGIASLGAGLFFGLEASGIESDLEAQLNSGVVPNEDLVARGEGDALFANVFLGTGIVALGVGVALILLDDGGGAEAPAASGGGEAGDEVSIEVRVAPGDGGGVVGLGLTY